MHPPIPDQGQVIRLCRLTNVQAQELPFYDSTAREADPPKSLQL